MLVRGVFPVACYLLPYYTLVVVVVVFVVVVVVVAVVVVVVVCVCVCVCVCVRVCVCFSAVVLFLVACLSVTLHCLDLSDLVNNFCYTSHLFPPTLPPYNLISLSLSVSLS